MKIWFNYIPASSTTDMHTLIQRVPIKHQIQHNIFRQLLTPQFTHSGKKFHGSKLANNSCFHEFYYRNEPQPQSPWLYNLWRAEVEMMMIIYFLMLIKLLVDSFTDRAKLSKCDRTRELICHYLLIAIMKLNLHLSVILFFSWNSLQQYNTIRFLCLSHVLLVLFLSLFPHFRPLSQPDSCSTCLDPPVPCNHFHATHLFLSVFKIPFIIPPVPDCLLPFAQRSSVYHSLCTTECFVLVSASRSFASTSPLLNLFVQTSAFTLPVLGLSLCPKL